MKNDHRLIRADRLFSMLVRQRDGRCRRCEKVVPYDLLQTHHLIKRRYRNTRYVLDAAVAVDWECHNHLENHPQEADEFAVGVVGEARFLELKALARDTTTRIDLDDVLTELRERAAA